MSRLGVQHRHTVPRRIIMDNKRDGNRQTREGNKNQWHQTATFNLMGLFSIRFRYLWTQMTFFSFHKSIRIVWVRACLSMITQCEPNELAFLLGYIDACALFGDLINHFSGVIGVVACHRLDRLCLSSMSHNNVTGVFLDTINHLKLMRWNSFFLLSTFTMRS